jgi:hypothetical protein
MQQRSAAAGRPGVRPLRSDGTGPDTGALIAEESADGCAERDVDQREAQNKKPTRSRWLFEIVWCPGEVLKSVYRSST